MAKAKLPNGLVQFCGMLEPYSEKGQTFRRNIGEFETQLAQCESCGYCRYDPLPSAEELAAFYQAEYAEASKSVYNLQAQFERGDLDAIAEHLIAQIRQYGYQGNDPLEAHDVGSALGVLVYALRKHGVNATGTEPNTGWVAAGNEFCKGALSAEPLDKYFRSSERKLHLVTLLHTLEHMPNPLNDLLEIRLRLHEEGILYICVPNALFLPAQMFGKECDENFVFPAHLHYFTPKSMSCLLRSAGFKILHLETRASNFGEAGRRSFFQAATRADPHELVDEAALLTAHAANFRTAELHVIACRDDRQGVPPAAVCERIEAKAGYERPFWRRVDAALMRLTKDQQAVLISDRRLDVLWEWAPRLAKLNSEGRFHVIGASELAARKADPALPLSQPATAQVIVDRVAASSTNDTLSAMALSPGLRRSEV